MKKNILVTGAGGRSVGSGILYALTRTNNGAKKRWNVIATDADPFSWGLYKADVGQILPFAKDPNYIKKIKSIINKYHIDAIIPGTQEEGEILTKSAAKLAPIPIVANRRELYPLMMDKFAASQALNNLGAETIETLPLSQWEKIVDKFGFPVIVKPTKGTGGSRGLHIVASKAELEEILSKSDESTAPCIQPYIGSEDQEYTVGVLTDNDGDLIDSIVMKRKLVGLSLLEKRNIGSKSYAISTGYSQGFIIKNKKIQDFCENLALRLESTGPLNIQLRVANKKIYVFEIHPRFSGTTPIRASVGFNEVDILLRNYLFDEKFSRIHYQYNVAAIRAFEHVIVPIKNMKK